MMNEFVDGAMDKKTSVAGTERRGSCQKGPGDAKHRRRHSSLSRGMLRKTHTLSTYGTLDIYRVPFFSGGHLFANNCASESRLENFG